MCAPMYTAVYRFMNVSVCALRCLVCRTKKKSKVLTTTVPNPNSGLCQHVCERKLDVSNSSSSSRRWRACVCVRIWFKR